jgi:hypothetical protein
MPIKNCGNCNWSISLVCENPEYKTGRTIDIPENPDCGYLTMESQTPMGWERINQRHMNVGDIVQEKSGQHDGTDAMVVSMVPFILVCTKTGTVWKTLNMNDFHTIFKARKVLFDRCKSLVK